MTRPFAPAYLAAQPDASAFLHPHHTDAKARLLSLQQRATQRCSPALLAILHAQHPPEKRTPAQEAHLHALAQEGTTAVITGQQVGFFLGPLYTLHKAASAIRLARQLEAESGKPVVPLFWLQVEDHDLAEIATCCLPQNNGEILTLRAIEHTDALAWRASVAHYTLDPQALSVAFEQLSASLRGLPFAQEVLDLLQQHYTPHRPIGSAFADLLHDLFADEGLLIFNPRDPALAPLAAPIHQHALTQAPAIEIQLKEREEALASANFDVQIPLRKDATISFFHPEGPEGPRYRILQDGEGFALAGHPARFTREEILARLQQNPRCFSTSALLRPLLQDQWFPTAAYVGGPGEIAYFAQMPPLYRLFDLPMPMILPRGRFTWIEPNQQKLLDQLGLSLHDLQAPEATLLARIAQQQPDHPLDQHHLRAQLQAPLQHAIAQLQAPLQDLDPNLFKPLQKLAQQFEDGLEKLITKIQRAQLSQDEHITQRLQAAKHRLYPNDAPQERIYGFPYLAARFGLQTLKQTLLTAYQPYQYASQSLHLHTENR